tara:strand:+ start:629 stop:907 length:279 start_codon:yes stop_codon:yes gene_type:complete
MRLLLLLLYVYVVSAYKRLDNCESINDIKACKVSNDYYYFHDFTGENLVVVSTEKSQFYYNHGKIVAAHKDGTLFIPPRELTKEEWEDIVII